VLREVHRELRAGRWDRRLARTAAVLLIVGLGMNVALVVRNNEDRSRASQIARSPTRQSLVDTAVVVAEATNARTGSRYTRQLAAMIGKDLSVDDAAAIDAAVHFETASATNGKQG
jgi:hypothetical protein